MKKVTITKNKLLAQINNNLPIFILFAVLSLLILSYQLSFWQINYFEHAVVIRRIENYNLYSAFLALLFDLEGFFSIKFPSLKFPLLRNISRIIQIPSVILVSIYVATISSLLNEIFKNGIFGVGYAVFYLTSMGFISVVFQVVIVVINSFINKNNTNPSYNLQAY